MQLRPHIVHIVGHTEAHHATTAAELIEACRIADGAISPCLLGLPDMTADARVQRRKAELLRDADTLLDAIARLTPAGHDPYTDPDTLAQAVEIGLLDAPHLRGNAAACGKIVTRMVGGACLAVDPGTGKPIAEAERVARALALTLTCTADRGTVSDCSLSDYSRGYTEPPYSEGPGSCSAVSAPAVR